MWGVERLGHVQRLGLGRHGDGKKGELVFPAYSTFSRLGVKIGFLGYTDPLVPIRQSPNYSKGIVYTKPEENLAYYVNVLREQEQCDFVIILAHLGLSQQIALANMPECEGVHYIFAGIPTNGCANPSSVSIQKWLNPALLALFSAGSPRWELGGNTEPPFWPAKGLATVAISKQRVSYC